MTIEYIGESQVEMYLARSGGKLGCPHPAHRFASPRNAPSRLILP
jgi:hypothetical protein